MNSFQTRSVKCDVMSLYVLWHRRLGKNERLIKMIFFFLLFLNHLDSCIECTEGKWIRTKKNGSKCSQYLLEIAHTDICGYFANLALYGLKNFISFIHFRVFHIFSINSNASALDVNLQLQSRKST